MRLKYRANGADHVGDFLTTPDGFYLDGRACGLIRFSGKRLTLNVDGRLVHLRLDVVPKNDLSYQTIFFGTTYYQISGWFGDTYQDGERQFSHVLTIEGIPCELVSVESLADGVLYTGRVTSGQVGRDVVIVANNSYAVHSQILPGATDVYVFVPEPCDDLKVSHDGGPWFTPESIRDDTTLVFRAPTGHLRIIYVDTERRYCEIENYNTIVQLRLSQ